MLSFGTKISSSGLSLLEVSSKVSHKSLPSISAEVAERVSEAFKSSPA